MINTLKMALREFIKNKYIAVSKLVKPGSSVLDVGCNKAEILEFLPNIDYYGIDINKQLIEELKKKRFNVHYADLDKDKLSLKKKFDYILLLDILEHIVNPVSLIEKSKKLVSNEGYIIISIPNDYHFFNKLRFIFNKEITPAFIKYWHLHIFPIKSGKNLIENNGLVILKIIDLPPTHKFIPKVVMNLLSKISRNNFSRNVIYLTKIKKEQT